MTPWTISQPGSSVHGFLQAWGLEGVAISSSKGSSQPRDQTHISCSSCIGRQVYLPLAPTRKPQNWYKHTHLYIYKQIYAIKCSKFITISWTLLYLPRTAVVQLLSHVWLFETPPGSSYPWGHKELQHLIQYWYFYSYFKEEENSWDIFKVNLFKILKVTLAIARKESWPRLPIPKHAVSEIYN